MVDRARLFEMKQRKKPLDLALANLITSTRTQKRTVSLSEFYGWLNKAIKGLGDINIVAERIGISERMIKQFITYEKLDANVQLFVQQRLIDSVDAVNYLAKFRKDEQKKLADLYVAKKLTSQDLRSIYQQKKLLPNLTIEQLIIRVMEGKTKKIAIVEFIVREGLKEKDIYNALVPVIGRDNILNVLLESHIGEISLTPEGVRLLKEYGRKNGISLRRIMSELLYS